MKDKRKKGVEKKKHKIRINYSSDYNTSLISYETLNLNNYASHHLK
jgi:hypothetical protein